MTERPTRAAFTGDLGKLAVGQLESQLSIHPSLPPADGPDSLLVQVRARLLARLASDASLERIARDLRMSTRTLRRRLGALDTSFQVLLEEVRRTRAAAYLAETELAVEQISVELGYGDPANFRRAFRRWEGVAPSTFRATRRADARLAEPLATLAANSESAPAGLGSELGWTAPRSEAE